MFSLTAIRLAASGPRRNLSSSLPRLLKLKLIVPERPNIYELYEDGKITLEQFKSDENKVFEKHVKQAIHSLNYYKFTPVQQQAILPVLQEKHGLVARAKTGTGKTMSFVLPLVQHSIDRWLTHKRNDRKVHSIVIAPTRDLAMQIHEEFKKVTRTDNFLRFRVDVRLWVGGVKSNRPWGSDVPQIIVMTPGRGLDWLSQGKWNQYFDQLDYRVFDEADRMLDQGFETQLHEIDAIIKKVRQPSYPVQMKNVLFSATVNERVTEFATSQIGNDYRYIDCVDPNETETHDKIDQTFVKTKSLYESHMAAVMNIVRETQKNPKYKAILFVPTTVGADFIYETMKLVRVDGDRLNSIWRLHGKLRQSLRDKSVRGFRKALGGVLVCTDVAARGMDFPRVNEVVQISPSVDLADYVHKIGRTGRAGASGKATLYLSEQEIKFKQMLQKKRGIKFATEIVYEPTEEDVKAFEEVTAPKDVVADYAMSTLGFQKSFADVFKIDKGPLVQNVVDMYRKCAATTESLFMSNRMFQMFMIPRYLVPDYIDVENRSTLPQDKKPRVMRDQHRRSMDLNRFPSNLSRGSGWRDRRSDDRPYEQMSDYSPRHNNRQTKRSFDSQPRKSYDQRDSKTRNSYGQRDSQPRKSYGQRDFQPRKSFDQGRDYFSKRRNNNDD